MRGTIEPPMPILIQALAAAPGVHAGRLLRALRPDAEHPYVLLGGDRRPGALHAATYEIVREHGDPEAEAGVVLLDFYAVPREADDEFVGAWEDDRLTGRGFLGTQLLRATTSTDLRFAELARWSSPLMIARAAGTPEHPHALYEAR